MESHKEREKYPFFIEKYLSDLKKEIGRLSKKDKDLYNKALKLADIYVELESYKNPLAKELKENIKMTLMVNYNISKFYNYYLNQFEEVKNKENEYRYYYAKGVPSIRNWYKISKNIFSENTFFRIENKKCVGILELEKRFCSKNSKCKKNKPKESWLLKSNHIFNKKNVLHFFTHNGFKRYKESELMQWHLENIKDQLYVRELNNLNDVDLLYADKYQIFVYSFPWKKDLKKYTLKNKEKV